MDSPAALGDSASSASPRISDLGQVALVELDDQGQGVGVKAVVAQVLAQVGVGLVRGSR